MISLIVSNIYQTRSRSSSTNIIILLSICSYKNGDAEWIRFILVDFVLYIYFCICIQTIKITVKSNVSWNSCCLKLKSLRWKVKEFVAALIILILHYNINMRNPDTSENVAINARNPPLWICVDCNLTY